MSRDTTAVEYRPVVGSDILYVGDDGSIWSSYRCPQRPVDMKDVPILCRKLKTGHCIAGYRSVVFQRDKTGKRVSKLVHRIVLEAFVGPCPDGMEGCHGPDSDKSNNRLSNLRWDTRTENNRDCEREGNHSPKRSKLTITDIPVIRKKVSVGQSIVSIAKEFGVHPNTITAIKSGRNWTYA